MRQVSNEVRNCHTHLYWACYRNPADFEDELRKAFDHLLRSVVDEYKLVTDAALSAIPPSAPASALALRLQVEETLVKIWDCPAREHWDACFKEWNESLELALRALNVSYAKFPSRLEKLRRTIGTVGQRLGKEDVIRKRLRKIIKSLEPLLAAENRYRVVMRKRISIHVSAHLDLFGRLTAALVNPSEMSRYQTKISDMVENYQTGLWDFERATQITFLEKAASVDSDWAAEWAETLAAQKDGDDDLTSTMLSQLPDIVLNTKARHLPWPGVSIPINYAGFTSVINHTFLGHQFPDAEIQKLYTIYLLQHRVDPSRALWVVAERLRFFMEPDKSAGRQAEGKYRGLHTQPFLDEFMRQSVETEISSALQGELGIRERVVWFFDIAGSTRLKDASARKLQLYEFALIRFNHARGTPLRGITEPVVVNTWGDAMIAVFNDAQSAADTAFSILEFSAELGLKLRFGATLGTIDLRVNPLRGVDAFGDAVNLAARLESMAKPGEFLTDTRLGRDLSTMARFSAKGAARPLKKALGEKKKGEKIDCFTVVKA